MLNFRIYYDDGHVSDQLPETIDRKYGVICILQQKTDGVYYMVSNAPYYLYIDEAWCPAYENDVIDYLVNKQSGVIKNCMVGRIVPKHIFSRIHEQAQTDRKKMD